MTNAKIKLHDWNILNRKITNLNNLRHYNKCDENKSEQVVKEDESPLRKQ